MADPIKVSDLTAASAITGTTQFYAVVGSDSRKVTLAVFLSSLGVASSTVASLGAATTPGIVKLATNGRKIGEGGGAGTGVLVQSNGSNWITFDAGTTVAA